MDDTSFSMIVSQILSLTSPCIQNGRTSEMPTIASKRALSRAWYVNSYGFYREKSTQRDPFRKSTSWNKTRIHDVVRSFEPSFVSSFPPVPFFHLTSLFLSSLTPCTMVLSLYLFAVSSPHSRSFLSLSKPLSTQRTCAFVYTSTRCPLPNGNSLLWEPEVARAYRGDDESQGRAIDPPPFAVPLPLSVRFTLLQLSICSRRVSRVLFLPFSCSYSPLAR